MSDKAERTAPVLHTRERIPWFVHQRAWEQYAKNGDGDQSAERVADRGGFAWAELVILLTGGDPFRPTDPYGHLRIKSEDPHTNDTS